MSVCLSVYVSISHVVRMQQESEVTSVERRNFFSLYCIQMEMKLIFANLSMLPLAVERLGAAYCRNHQEVLLLVFFCCGS